MIFPLSQIAHAVIAFTLVHLASKHSGVWGGVAACAVVIVGWLVWFAVTIAWRLPPDADRSALHLLIGGASLAVLHLFPFGLLALPVGLMTGCVTRLQARRVA